MHIYRAEKEILVLVQPGKDYPENSDFVNGEGEATMFNVTFKKGRADVSGSVGSYMLEKKLAYKSVAAAIDARSVILHA